MRINSNIPALNAFNALTVNNNKFTKTIQQLSTGMRINSAADDAAGLAISETLRAQTSSLDRAKQNAQDGISLLQIAEGALGETNSMLQRMRELAVQAANDTLTSQDRNYLQMKIDALKDQIDLIAKNTQFNTKSLLDGSLCGTWSSSDTSTKAYIRGSLETEGNFRIEVKTNPGEAQVQKSNIFMIKHENVVTNLQLNSADGFGGLSIDGLPAGDYSISTSMGAGGDIYYIYDAKLDGEVPEANTSGADETMTLSFYSEDNKSASFSFDLGSDLDTEEKVAEAVVKAANDKGTITVNENEVQLTATLNEDKTTYTIHAKSQEHITKMTSSVSVNASTKTGTAQNNAESVQWDRFTVKENGKNGGELTVSFNGSSETITVAANERQSSIAGKIQNALKDMGASNTFISSSSSNYYVWIEKHSEGKSFDIIGSGGSGFAIPDKGQGNTYKISSGGSITVGNYSGADETLTLTLADSSNSSSNRKTVSVTIPTGTDKEAIPGLIQTELTSQLSNKLTLNGKEINFTFTDNGDGSFTIKSSDENDVWGSRIFLSYSISSTITSKGETKADENEAELITIPMTETDGLAVLTGTYGVNADDAFSVKLEGANGKVQNNASILFEVTGAAYDTTSKMGTVTLSAISNVLGVDGTVRTYTNQKIVISTNHTSINLGSLLGEDDDHFVLELKEDFDISEFAMGNKFVYNICGIGDPAKATADTSIFISGKQDSSWPSIWDESNGSYVTKDNNKIQYNLNAEAVSNSELHFRNFYLDSDTGNVYNGDVKLTVNEDFQTASKNFTGNPEPAAAFTANYVGKIATGDMKLYDLKQFWDSSGVFMLQEPQTITISQNDGKRAQITLNASDTLNDVRLKLNDAIANKLEQGLYVKEGNDNNFVTFVDNPTGNNGLETVKGTFLIRSVIPGSKGELTFSSSYGGIIDALGLNTVKSSQDTSYTASVYNAHDNTLIARNVQTSENMLKGIIDKNVDVEFNAMSSISAVWSDADKNFVLTPDSDAYVTTLHLVKNDLNFQTGAGEGDYVTLDIGDMSSEALGINSINVMTFERASKAITTLDNAIRQISSQRAKIGSYQNALESSIENLTITSTNLTSADSRIRDTDMAKTMMQFVKFQILNQAGTSMLAQANQMTQSVLNLMQ